MSITTDTPHHMTCSQYRVMLEVEVEVGSECGMADLDLDSISLNAMAENLENILTYDNVKMMDVNNDIGS